MAEQLAAMPPRARGRKPKYDWVKLLNGRIWRLTKGKDFSCSVESFAHHFRRRAQAAGLRANVVTESDVNLAVRAVGVQKRKS
jgi:hypothetical protein